MSGRPFFHDGDYCAVSSDRGFDVLIIVVFTC